MDQIFASCQIVYHFGDYHISNLCLKGKKKIKGLDVKNDNLV